MGDAPGAVDLDVLVEHALGEAMVLGSSLCLIPCERTFSDELWMS